MVTILPGSDAHTFYVDRSLAAFELAASMDIVESSVYVMFVVIQEIISHSRLICTIKCSGIVKAINKQLETEAMLKSIILLCVVWFGRSE